MHNPTLPELLFLLGGACSRLGDKELNAALNAFIDQIKANGDLAKVQEKWMGSSMLNFPASLPGIPFVSK